MGAPARAVLPVIGVFANQAGEAFPGIKLISKLSGYKRYHLIYKAIFTLISMDLVRKEKRRTRRGRHNVYYLTEKATWFGHSYFPFLKSVIEAGYWANLTSCEKAAFGVLATKGSVERAKRDSGDPDVHCQGDIYPKKYIPLSGVSKQGFYNGLYGLSHKEWVFLDEGGSYEVYREPHR